jgi:uncharacterized protein (TIGR03083 family)
VPPLEVGRYVEFLDADGELLATAAASAGPHAKVPSCPEWVVRDLVRHIGGVHRWATDIVATPRLEPWDVDLDEVVSTWPDDTELVAWFRSGHRDLVAALRRAPADLQCWTFLAARSPLLMWARRQAHETAIHRIDAELAAGETSQMESIFAVDGIDELLTCFITRKSSRLHADPPRCLRVIATDTGDRWEVRFGTGAVTTVRSDGDVPADATLEGAAGDLYLALWHRRARTALTFTGDTSTISSLLDDLHIRWG